VKIQLPPEHIELNLLAADRFEAIRVLFDRLVHARAFPPGSEESIFHEIAERERTMSTGIGFGLAIPHGASDLVPDPVLAFGHSPTGVPFDSLDGAPVRFIFLFIAPRRDFQRHLQCLRFVARGINGMKDINPSSTPEEISLRFNRAAGE